VAIVLAAVFGGDLSLGATAGAALLIEFVIWYERRAKARRS
jgi:hypothetical protein